MIHHVKVRSLVTGLEHLWFPPRQCAYDAEKRHDAIVVGVSLEEWNERYRAREDLDGEPAALLVDAVRGVPPGRALDLACGAGRNALWLEREGWDVVAIDGAGEAIRIIREHETAIDARVMDLETGAPLPFPDDSFELVSILYYLHRPLFAEARRVVKPGGLIVIAIRMQGRYAGSPSELARTFAGFDILHSHEGEIAGIVARK